MSSTEFAYLRDFLKDKSGLVLTEEKQYLLDCRLLPVARDNGMETLAELVAAMKRPGASVLQGAVVEAMTINESFFFRDKTPFDNFTNVMMPAMLEERRAMRKLRIWCAAASSGQEPYSLAMLLKDMSDKMVGWNIDIVGTDLSSEILEKAKAGLYSQFEVQRGLPISLLVKYFKQQGSLWQIDSAIRAMVQYKKFNLLESFRGLGKFDIVFCRNVLIYFDPPTKRDILERAAQQLAPDGYLVLGAAETVIGLTDQFSPVSGVRGLYMRTDAAKSAPSPVRSRIPESASGGAAARSALRTG